MQAASIWADKIGDGGSRGRGLRARARSSTRRTSPPRPSSRSSTGSARSGPSWSSCCWRASSSRRRSAERIKHPADSRRDLREQIGDRESAFVVLAGRLPRGLLERSRRQGARAAGHRDQQVERAARRVHAGRPDACPSPSRRARSVGQDRPLVRFGASTTPEYAIASASRRCQLDPDHVGPWRRWPTSIARRGQWKELVADRCPSHAELEQEHRAQGRAVPAPWPSSSRSSSPTPARPWPPTSRPCAATSAAWTRHRRARAAAPPRPGLGSLIDILRKKSQIVERRRAGDHAAPAGRRALGVALGRQRARGRGLPARCSTVDPQNLPALKALGAALREGRPTEAYLDVLEHQLEVTRHRHRARLRCTSAWRRCGNSSPASPNAHRRRWRTSCSSTIGTAALSRHRAPVPRRSATGTRWSTSTAATSRSKTDAGGARRAVRRVGQVFEEELQRPRSRGRGLQRHPRRSTPTTPTRSAALARIYEQTEQWDRAVEIMEQLVRRGRRARRRSTCTTGWARSSTSSMQMPESAEERLSEALSAGSGHVPSMLSLISHVQAARRLAEGRADDGARRELHAERRWRRRACSSRPARSTRSSSPTSSGQGFLRPHVSSSIPSTWRRARRWPRSTSTTRSGRRSFRCSRCWRARPTAAPTRSCTCSIYRLAKAADELGDQDKALKCYRQAYELDSDAPADAGRPRRSALSAASTGTTPSSCTRP